MDQKEVDMAKLGASGSESATLHLTRDEADPVGVSA